MARSTTAQVPADSGGHPALRRLIGITVEEFAEKHWGTEPLVTQAASLPGPFADLFSNDAVDELVSERGLRAPFLRVAKDGTTMGDSAFTSGGGIGATVADQASDDKLLHLFADGSTIVLQGLHRMWPPLIQFSQQLAADLGHPVQVNAYVTPPQNTGFSDHYDVHDVFVLQVEGEKQWRIRRPVLDSPLRDQPWDRRRSEVEEAAGHEPLLEFTLRPGDCLYLPRGYLHSASALGGVSTHLTIGVHPWTRHHVVEQLVHTALAAVAQEPQLRVSLPFGTDVGDPSAIDADVDLARAALVRALERLTAADVAPGLAARSRRAQRAAPLAPLAQLRAASRLARIPTLFLRPHLAARLTEHDGYAVLDSRAGRLRVELADLPAVRLLVESGRMDVTEIGEDLARRLLLAGLAMADDPPGATQD